MMKDFKHTNDFIIKITSVRTTINTTVSYKEGEGERGTWPLREKITFKSW